MYLFRFSIVLIPNVSSIEPYTSILPLIFVLSVSGLKEAIEDYVCVDDRVMHLGARFVTWSIPIFIPL